eukprot:scaffold244371_cov34-Prasinocladus_malaysianus.AAC.1
MLSHVVAIGYFDDNDENNNNNHEMHTLTCNAKAAQISSNRLVFAKNEDPAAVPACNYVLKR